MTKETKVEDKVLTNDQASLEANYELAIMYGKGKGVEFDMGKALKHIEIASHNNHPGAKLFLSYLYGRGVKDTEDYKTAFDEFFGTGDK